MSSEIKSNVKIGKKLKYCRETLRPKKTQQEIADDLGIQRTYLSALERDEGLPSYDLLAKLVDYYETSFDFIFGHAPETKISSQDKELLDCAYSMGERSRSVFFAIGRTIIEEDQKWQSYDFGLDAVESLLGEDFIEELKQRLAMLTMELGSTSAAIAALRSSILAEENSEDRSK